jgi:hypothetical protein
MIAEISKGTLVDNVSDITVDFDALLDDSSNAITRNAGKVVPLVKIANSVINFGSINYVRVNVGESLLPTLSMTFNADANFIENDFPLVDTIATVYIGNPYDTDFKTIKCDFLILSANQSGGFIDIKGELLADTLYESNIESFKDTSAIDVIKKVCENTGLGFCTNITASDDVMTWLQCNETHIEFLTKHVIPHMWLGDSNKIIKVFIDAWYRLNVIEVLAELDGQPAKEYISINYNTGEQLEEPQQLILNNNPNSPNVLSMFASYQLLYNNSAQSAMTSADVYLSTIDMPNKEVNHVQKQSALTNLTQADKHIDTFADRRTANSIQAKQYDETYSNTHTNWHAAAIAHSWSTGVHNRVVLQLNIHNILNILYVGKLVEVEIMKRKAKYKRPVPEDTARQEEHAGDDVQPHDNENTLNQRLTGDYMISSIQYEFTKSKLLLMQVGCIRRLWPVLDIDKLK